MIVLRWREIALVRWRWIGPSDQAAPLKTPGVGAAAAIIGPPGPAGQPAYIHTQASASAEWVVNHNLGVRPLIVVLSPGGVEVEAHPIHMSTNQVRIHFAAPATGSVRCI